MNSKSVLALFAICAVVLGFYLVDRAYFRSTGQIQERKDKILAEKVEPKDVKSVEIERTTNDKTTKLAFDHVDDEHWDMTEPLKDWADRSEIESILSTLDYMRREAPVKGTDLAAFGLDKPSARLKVVFKDDKKRSPVELLVGKKTMSESSDQGNVYVKLADAPEAAIVDNSIVDKLNKEVKGFRSKDIFRFESHRIDKVELARTETPDKSLTCAKEKVDNNDVWRLTQPVEARADQGIVSGLIDKIKSASKEEFVADDVKAADLEQYGLAKPQLAVKLTSKKEGEPVREIMIGGPVKDKSEQLYAKCSRNDSVFAIKKDLLNDLSKELKDVRDKKVVNLAATKAVELRINTGGAEIVMSRKDDAAEWKITAPKDRKADDIEVKNLAEAVEKLEAVSWPAEKADDLDKYGLKTPAATFTVTLAPEKAEEGKAEGEKKPGPSTTLLIGKKEGERCFVKLASENPIIEVKADIYDKATRGYLAYVSRRVLDFVKSDAKRLDIIRDGTLYACSYEDNDWKLTKPVAAKSDKSNVDDIIWDISALDAVKIVAEEVKDFAQYGLDKPIVTVTVETITKKDDKEEKVSHQLQIGNKTDEGSFARVEGKDTVFIVRSGIVERFDKELHTRTVMELKPEDAQSLRIQHAGAEEIVCEKKDNAWKITTPKDQDTDSVKIEDIINELRDLKAERHVEYKAADLAKYGLDKPAVRLAVKVRDKESTLLLGNKKDDDNTYAKVGDDDGVFLVKKSTVDTLSKKLPDLLKQKLTPEPEKKPEEEKPEEKK